MYCRCYLDVFQASAAVGTCNHRLRQSNLGCRAVYALQHAAPAGVTKKSNKRRLVHTGCWPLQLTLWLLLIVACFFMPNSVYRCCLLV